MRNICFICSVALILLGGVGYFAWDSIGAAKQSITAAIPAFIGIPMLIGGIISIKNNMMGMHIAVLASTLGALAGVGKLAADLFRGKLDWSLPAPKLVISMTIISLIFTIYAVRSFIAARKAREAGE